MAYKYAHNPGIQDSQSLKSSKPATNRSRNGTLIRNDALVTRHRKSEDDEMTGGARCCFGFLVLIAQILLHGVLGLVWFWIVHYHSDEKATWGAFAWRDNPELEFNLHPVLMITGFIYFSGQSMLMYRTCRCCRRIWSKLLHTLFHLLATPCIAFAFIAVWDSHAYRKPEPIPHFYSLHSWMGATTMGLFALQFVVGFFSFILLLCCESATASFRAALVPIHSTFGITTFVMAVATACAGLTEKAFFTLSVFYSKWVPYLTDPQFNISTTTNGIIQPNPNNQEYKAKYFEESLTVNALGASLIALAIVMPILVLHPKFRFRPQRIITVTHDRYG